MASRFTRHISPRRISIAQLLLDFQVPISREAADALEKRDACWKIEYDDLRSQCLVLDRELTVMVEDVRLMHAAINNLKDERKIHVDTIKRMENAMFVLEREKKDAVDRVLDYKAKLEKSMWTVDVLKEEKVDFEHELDRVKSKKNDEIDRNLKEKEELETKLTEEARRIEILEEESRELQAEVGNLKKKKANETQRILSKNNEKMKVLERKNGELEAQLCKTKSEMSAEIDRISEEKANEILRISKEKMASEDLNRVLNAKLKERANTNSQLNDRIGVLAKEKEKIEAELSKIKNDYYTSQLVQAVEVLKSKNSELESENDRIQKEKLGLEVQSSRIEKELKETISGLLAKNGASEAHKGKIEKIDSKVKKGTAEESLETISFKQGQAIAQLKKNNKALKSDKDCVEKRLSQQQADLEQKDEKIMELVNRTEVLQKEKGEMEAEILKAKKDYDESGRISKVKKDLEHRKRQVEEAHKQISEYMNRLEVLETTKEADLKKIEEMRNILTDNARKLFQKINLLQSEKRELVQANKEKIEEIKRVMEDEDKKKVQRIELLEKEKKELKERFCQANKEIEKILDGKRSKEDENNKTQCKQLQRITELQRRKKEMLTRVEALEKDKREMETRFSQENEQKSEEMKRILDEKMTFESEKRTLEDEYKKKVQRIEVLEKEKKEMEESFCREIKEKSEEIKKISDEKMAFESEKRTMEDEYKKKVLEQVQRIEVLEKEKKEMEERLCRENKEKSEEIMKILDEKRAIEAESKKTLSTMEDERKKVVSELVQRVSVLEKEKMEIEGKICEVDKKKSEEMEKILKEKIAMEAENRVAKEVDAKKILELTGRIGVLKREKGEIEAEIMEKDEVIKDLDQENTNLLETKRKLEMQITELVSRCKNIFGMLSKASQNKGKKSAGVAHCTEHNRSISHNAGKRKRDTTEELSGGSSSDVVGMAKKVVKNGVTNVEPNVSRLGKMVPCQSSRKKPQWETDQNLLDELDVDNELCLKAVCSLYRRRRTVLAGTKGGIALAEYLIDSDPEGRMMKTVADVQEFDLEVFDTCIKIAKQFYKQVFEIYNKSEDPLFLA